MLPKVLPKIELVELVAPMLEELCGGDAAAAEDLAGQLWQRLTGGQGRVEAAEDKGTRALVAAVNLGDNMGIEDEADKRARELEEEAQRLSALAVDDR